MHSEHIRMNFKRLNNSNAESQLSFDIKRLLFKEAPTSRDAKSQVDIVGRICP